MIDDDTTRRLIARVVMFSHPVGGQVIRYLRLHKPQHQRLRLDKVSAILEELVPAIVEGKISRNGREWSAPLDVWRAAFDAVFDAHLKGTLKAPLNGHGYLFEVLMRMADEHEAAAEKQREIERRHRVVPPGATATTNQGPVSIADALPQPVRLAAPDAVPPPAHIRERMAELTGRKKSTT